MMFVCQCMNEKLWGTADVRGLNFQVVISSRNSGGTENIDPRDF
jgi:hypothetical protein